MGRIDRARQALAASLDIDADRLPFAYPDPYEDAGDTILFEDAETSELYTVTFTATGEFTFGEEGRVLIV